MDRAVFGREPELALLSRVLDSIPAGPAAVLVAGDPGTGKTTVLSEAVEGARLRSYRVLSCQPNESEARLSYAALGDLLEQHADEVLEELPPPQRTALEIALLRTSAQEVRLDQRAVSSAFYATLRALAQSGPVIVALDDTQWLDRPSARVIEFALRRLRDVPIGVVAAMRSTGPEALPLGIDRAWPDDRLFRLHLGPLSVPAMQHLLQSRLSARFSHSVLIRIHEASGGNPLFGLEIGRALLRGRVEPQPGQPLPVPSNLAALVHDRLSALPEGVREVLLVVSAIAQPSVSLVERAIGSPRSVRDSLEAGLRAGVIEMGAGRVRFTHPLLATVLYSQAPLQQRQGIHRRLAEVEVEPEQRARHMALASEGTDEETARALDEAARKASDRGAPDAAAELSELARSMTPQDHIEDVMRRTIQAGRFDFEAADMERAQSLLESAVAGSAPGPLRAEALRYMGRVRYQNQDAQAARALAEQALTEAGEDPVLRSAIELDLASAAQMSGDFAQAAVHARNGLELSEAAGDNGTVAEALGLVAFYEFLSGRGVPEQMIERAVSLESDGEQVRPLRSPTFYRACISRWTDNLEDARSGFEALEKRAREHGDEGSLPVLLSLLSEVECWSGDWDAASSHAEESLMITRWTGQELYRALALYAVGLVEANLGHVDAARNASEEGFALGRRTGSGQVRDLNAWVMGFLEISLGNPAEAHRVLEPLTEASTVESVDPGVLRFMPDEIEALVSLGQTEKARALLDAFASRGRDLGRSWVQATAGRCWGLVAAFEGDVVGALGAFEEGLKHHERLGQPFELGRTLLAQGQVQRRAKQWRAARGSLEEALEIFERLGAALWAERARAEVARIGGRPPTPFDLTPTEQRVAELVIGGLTNREVAEVLFLSVSTVQANLRRIYTKLGVRSRTQLALRLGPS